MMLQTINKINITTQGGDGGTQNDVKMVFQIINNLNTTTQGGDGGTPKCIEKSKLCDGKKDCQDGADEKNACSNSLCASLGCEFSCRPSLEGGACSCPVGKKVSNDSRSCIDRNECEEWNVDS